MHSATRPASPLVLLADIGGTKLRFALADPGASKPLLTHSIRSFQIAAWDCLADAAQHYLEDCGEHPGRAVIAVAGLVQGDNARMTNHPWVVSRQQLATVLGNDDVQIVNDFVAQTLAIPLLGEDELATIGPHHKAPPRQSAERTCAVLGAGTGLGVGALLKRRDQWSALSSEGGHAAFAPGNEEESAILDRMRARFGRVSNERLLSGAGVVNLHRVLGELSGQDPGPTKPEDVTAGAAAGDPRCQHAIDVFCAVFGAIAGDLVMTFGAWDGAYLSGGLIEPLLPAIRDSRFRERFEDKGPYADAMARVPTFAVLHPQPGLLGAASIAVRAMP